jgi:hypothetical protein
MAVNGTDSHSSVMAVMQMDRPLEEVLGKEMPFNGL